MKKKRGRRKVKRRYSSRSRGRIKGIMVSTEMMLLLTAIIVLVIIAFYGYSKMVLAQATSSKYTLNLVSAEAKLVTGYGGYKAIVATVYVQNTGSRSITVNYLGVKFNYYGTTYTAQQPVNVQIQPGESRVISAYLYHNYIRYLNTGNSVYVYVKAGTNEIGRAVQLQNP